MSIGITNNDFFPNEINDNSRLMVFIDGENFAIRYKEVLNKLNPPKHVKYKPDIILWSDMLDRVCNSSFILMRKYYYTSIRGDSDKIEETEELLKTWNIDTPRVFKKRNELI